MFEIQTESTTLDLCFVLFLVCLYVCVCKCLPQNNMRMYTSNQYSNIRGPLREYCLIQTGASGLPYYCTSICARFCCTCLASCVDSKTKIKKTSNKIHVSEVHWGSAVRFSQSLLGFLITAPPSVYISAVLVSLAVWIQNQKKRSEQGIEERVWWWLLLLL